MSEEGLKREFQRLIAEAEIPAEQTEIFLAAHRRVAAELAGLRRSFLSVPVIGIHGAQGSGKSTFVRFLTAALAGLGLRAVSLSLDDFYLTRAERSALAVRVHPLFVTRGVPGTHDLTLLLTALDALQLSEEKSVTSLPVFNKAKDDREEEKRIVHGAFDLVLLEGWCVGSRPQSPEQLKTPVNELERTRDQEGVFRRRVNDHLLSDYANLFSRLSLLIHLSIPDFSLVERWRSLQEEKLRRSGGGSAVMDAAGLRFFMEHFERIIRHDAVTMPGFADIIVKMDADHAPAEVEIRPK